MDQVIEWRHCVGELEGRGFEVSNAGVVRKTKLYAGGIYRTRELKMFVGASGYIKIGIQKAALTATCRQYHVHVLVAEAFHGLRPPGKQVNHIDGNRLNNYASNLEWVSPSQNQKHAAALRPRRYKRFSDREIRQMHKCAKIGLPYGKICAAFGQDLQPYELSRILNGTRRKGVYLTLKKHL